MELTINDLIILVTSLRYVALTQDLSLESYQEITRVERKLIEAYREVIKAAEKASVERQS